MPNINKNTTIIISIGIIAILILLLFLLYPKIYKSEKTTITTQGSAQMKVMPDSMVIFLYTQVVNESAETAKNRNSEIVDATIKALLNLGINRSDIETEQFSIFPNYNWTEGTQEIIGYTVSQNIKVNLENFDLAGKVIDAAVNAGALVSYINFELSLKKQNELKEDLLSEATKDARIKADSIASGLGKRIINVVSVSTSDYGYYPIPIFRAEPGIELVKVKEAVTDITPKKLELNAQVSVTFEIG